MGQSKSKAKQKGKTTEGGSIETEPENPMYFTNIFTFSALS